MSAKVSFPVLILMSVMLSLLQRVAFADIDDITKLISSSKSANRSRIQQPSASVYRGCCQREPRIKYFGESGTGERIEIDTGRCRKRCNSGQKHIKKKNFQKLLKHNPSIDPMELYKLHVSKNFGQAEISCPKGKICGAQRSRMEKFLTKKGRVTATIVEECSCQPNKKQCRRHSRSITMHKNTPLEVTLNVGSCRGHCARDLKCQPTTSRTISIEGPNGAECISIIEECSCSFQCYKASHFQQYYDYSEGFQDIKTIDVGKCMGGCTSQRENHCVEKDENNNRCVMSLSTSSECRPLTTKVESLVQDDGFLKNISTISHCHCF